MSWRCQAIAILNVVLSGCFVPFLNSTRLTAADADDSLHARIDRLVSEKAAGTLADRSTDAEFMRRISLDLAGQIPTAGEVRSFLKDTSLGKREALIDRLLADDRYCDRMTDVFNTMLIERRTKHEEWLNYLRTSLAANKPWDQMAREILAPDAGNELTRGSALFYTARLEHYGQNPPDVPGLVRDVGRMFLGVDVQCAQCHDHLFVDQYKQVDYQGLYAFVGTATLRQDLKFPAVGENPLLRKIAFKSVFEGVEKATGPRLPGGMEIAIPEFPKGEEYLVPPDKKQRTPGVLKFSPMRALSENLARIDNPAFARNIVNRLWWLMMGRGLVDPLDLHHADNPPSHPELLDLLAREMVAHGFDIKWLLRELALSETYQRSGLLPSDATAQTPVTAYRSALERPLSADQIMTILRQATGKTMTDEKSLTEIRASFEKIFANPPKEPEVSVAPTVKAALFLSNDRVVLSWFEPHDGNLVDRLCKLDSCAAIADEAYLSILSRLPSESEQAEIEGFMANFNGPRERAIQHVGWALASSTEFITNH